MSEKSIFLIIDAVQALVDQSRQGFALDPEVDFESMRNIDNPNEADPKLYEKTGKLISVHRALRPLKLIVFLDINVNMKLKAQSSRLKANTIFLDVLDHIINHFSGEILVEVRNGENDDISGIWKKEIEGYNNEEYKSKIESILEYAEFEIKNGSIALVVSDFLELGVMSYELGIANFVGLQIELPVASSNFHSYYLKGFERPDVPYWFVV